MLLSLLVHLRDALRTMGTYTPERSLWNGMEMRGESMGKRWAGARPSPAVAVRDRRGLRQGPAYENRAHGPRASRTWGVRIQRRSSARCCRKADEGAAFSCRSGRSMDFLWILELV